MTGFVIGRIHHNVVNVLVEVANSIAESRLVLEVHVLLVLLVDLVVELATELSVVLGVLSDLLLLLSHLLVSLE